ncbi:MAG TPA: hypothetical protein VI338_02030, partial [Nitrososphaera sp.]|nr:hypothetical protein [Nitrososphaera sp.]
MITLPRILIVTFVVVTLITLSPLEVVETGSVKIITTKNLHRNHQVHSNDILRPKGWFAQWGLPADSEIVGRYLRQDLRLGQTIDPTHLSEHPILIDTTRNDWFLNYALKDTESRLAEIMQEGDFVRIC